MDKKNCIDCGKKIDFRSERCYSCSNRNRWKNKEYKKRVGVNISNSLKGNKNMLGKKQTEITKEKIRNSNYHLNLKGTKENEKNPSWKGDDVGYNALHNWIAKHFKKSILCEICGLFRKLEWSNKDHKYSRNREDWQYICRSCHRRYDNAKRRKN